MIIFASDHAGYELKELLKNFFSKEGIAFRDAGTDSAVSCNYAEFGARAAEYVSLQPDNCKAVLICGSGVGMSIVANKFKNVRAVLAASEDIAVMSRKHNNTNVLCLGARYTDFESAKRIVLAWLKTDFEGGRHQQRIEYIAKLEEKFCLNKK